MTALGDVATLITALQRGDLDRPIERFSDREWINSAYNDGLAAVQDLLEQIMDRGEVPSDERYGTVRNSDPKYGVRLYKQDHNGPSGAFRMCRRLDVSQSLSAGDLVTIAVELYRRPPREWPPGHIGDSTAGISLSFAETKDLRDWLDLQLSNFLSDDLAESRPARGVDIDALDEEALLIAARRHRLHTKGNAIAGTCGECGFPQREEA